MNNSVAAVLLDLDGTLLDTAQDFATVLQQLCLEENTPPPDYAAVRATVSHGARALVTLSFGLTPGQEGENTRDSNEFERLRLRLLELYALQLDVYSKPFDGTQLLLDFLASNAIPWGIVTNKPSQFAAPLIKGIKFDPAPATLICPDHVSNPKPHPEPLLLAAKELQVPARQCIYAGDHIRDIDAGAAAGMTTIAAAYGYIDDDENVDDWQADFTVDSIPAMIDVIQALNDQ